ncbi:MAG: hypothetical protein J7D61_02855 [Marichromatium sp.]|nr:hypothetical protein [Marichromatium sp.]
MTFPEILLDRLWHSTTHERYKNIFRDGAILPDPAIPDSAHWCTSKGLKHYPYVRTLGGVSLFEFRDFDPENYSEDYIASWHSFVPLSHEGGNKVWIEINRSAAHDSLIDGDTLIKKWKQDGAYEHNITPRIEAAHIGPICVTKTVRVINYTEGLWKKIR